MGLVEETIKKGKQLRPPIWLMRQAGRYMHEYRKIRQKYSFLEMCYNPELAAQITLQPIKSFDMDAAIIFSDILPILCPMGLNLEYQEKKGPIIHNPIKTEKDIKSLKSFKVEDDLIFIAKALKIVRREMDISKDLIGFSGAPFTVACYAIEGQGSKNFNKTKSLFYQEPKIFHSLMKIITKHSKEYLLMQIRAGANIVQIFDSWGGILSPIDYKNFIQPYNEEIIKYIATESNASSILFVKGGISYFPFLKNSSTNALGLDWTSSLTLAQQILGDKNKTLQGNLDPLILLADKKTLHKKILLILEEAKKLNSFIFNLGHGILPETPRENVKFLVEKVKEFPY